MFDFDIFEAQVFESGDDVLAAVASGFLPIKKALVKFRILTFLDIDDQDGTTWLEVQYGLSQAGL